MFTVVLAAILVGDLLWWWHADRVARSLPRPARWRLLVGLFMGGQVALVLWILGGRALAESGWNRPPQPLSAAAYLWHLLVLPATWALVVTTGTLFLVWQTGRRLALLTSAGRRLAPAPAGPDLSPPAAEATSLADAARETPTRRQFLGMLTAAAPAVLTVGGVAYSAAQLRRLRVRSIDLPLPALPPELNGVRIALVSDLHVGTFTGPQTLKHIVEQTSRLDADLVLLPGDLINNSLADLPAALDAVADMQSRHGSYLSVGNHDLIDDGAEFVRRTGARLPLLVDESHTVTVRGHPVQLLGLPWQRDEDRIADSVRRLVRRVAPGAFPILLAHHPHAFDAAAAAGIPLTVSGHTHGGQLMLADSVGFGPLLYRYWSGLYRKPEHGAALVVSNGAGHWFPLRTGAPAEIIELTLRSAEG